MIVLLNPFVDDGATPCHSHWTENGSLIEESTRFGDVAASLGEEDGHGVVDSLLLQGHVAALNIVDITTPLVGVQTEELDAIAASEVVLENWTEPCDIRMRVTDGDIPVAFDGTVVFEIHGCGLDIGHA